VKKMNARPVISKSLRLLPPALMVILAMCVLLIYNTSPARCQEEEGDFLIVIELYGGDVRIPADLRGNRVSGEVTTEAKGGHVNSVCSFEGTLSKDALRGDIRYKRTETTAGYEETLVDSFEALDVELPIKDGLAHSASIEVTLLSEYIHEDSEKDYSETDTIDFTAYADVSNVIGDVDGTTVDNGDTESSALPPPPGDESTPGGVTSIGDVPGPESWPQAATGIMIPGLFGMIMGIWSMLFRGGSAPPLPAGTQSVEPSPPPVAAPLDYLSDEATRWITNQRRYSLYDTNEEYRALIERMHRECFGPDGKVDWERYCDYRFGPVDDMKTAYNAKEDQLLVHAIEFAKAAKTSLYETGVAIKDGVVHFGESLIAMPGFILQGYKGLADLQMELVTDLARDFWNPNPFDRQPGLLDDLVNQEVIEQTGVNLYETVGKELLPIEEIKCYLEGDATLEERLWAIPSGAVKIANLFLFSPRLARLPVKGIPEDITLIRSARPANRAVEAARASMPAEVQAEYEAYKASVVEKASSTTETVEGGGMLTKEQVLESMGDPAVMRELKGAPVSSQGRFTHVQNSELYNPTYREVIELMEDANPGVEFRMKSVRTPGQKAAINTDNDVILQRKVIARDGSTYWEEVPVKEWKPKYDETFARNSDFNLEKAKAKFPDKDWNGMTLEEQHSTWTEKHGQETMHVKEAEAATSFSDQPTAMDPNWQPGSGSPISEGRLLDPEQLGLMERYKTLKGWSEGDVMSQTEAMEQASKLGKLSKKLVAQAQERTGYAYQYPKLFDQGMEIINMRKWAPAVRDVALRNLGFSGGYEEFMNKLTSWVGGLR
jgi:hypothetical protein